MSQTCSVNVFVFGWKNAIDEAQGKFWEIVAGKAGKKQRRILHSLESSEVRLRLNILFQVEILRKEASKYNFLMISLMWMSRTPLLYVISRRNF